MNNTHSRMPPKSNEVMYVRARGIKEEVPPFVIADFEASILVHPATKMDNQIWSTQQLNV